MDETRRDIFRTSVVAALGIAAGAAVGYEVGRNTVPDASRRLLATLAGSVVAVYDQTSNSNSWFFFQFDSTDLHTITMYRYTNTTFPGGAPTSINVVDTDSWFHSLKLQPVGASNTATTILYNKNPSGTGTITVTTTTGGVLNKNDTSVQSLLMALLDMQQYAGSWNEIGKQ